MKTIGTVTLLGMFALGAASAIAQKPFIDNCAEDSRIDSAKKTAIDSAAMQLVQALVGTNPSAVVDLMSKEGRAGTTSQQLSDASNFSHQFKPSNFVVQHTYLVNLKGTAPQSIVCAVNLTKPDGWNALAVKDVPQQAYASITADTVNNKLSFTIWLVPEDSKWKVQSFWVNISSLGDKDSVQLWNLAHAQIVAGHTFNAALLDSAATQVANRGPNFQMGITQSISEDLSHLTIPAEVKGRPPFIWKDGTKNYKVNQVGPIAIGGKIYVTIVHEVPSWQTEAQVDGWNKELMRYFKLRFPEYSDVFAGIVVRATEEGGRRGYGTVEKTSPSK